MCDKQVATQRRLVSRSRRPGDLKKSTKSVWYLPAIKGTVPKEPNRAKPPDEVRLPGTEGLTTPN